MELDQRSCIQIPGEQPVSAALMIKRLQDRFRDPYNEVIQISADGITTQEPADASSFHAVRHFPSISGHNLLLSVMFVQNLGMSLSYGGCIVLSFAYLYKAAMKAGLLKQQWPDMEFVVDMQRKAGGRPFVLDPDGGLAAMPKCFGMALGVKLSAFQGGRRPQLPTADFISAKGRRVETICPAMHLTQNQSNKGEKNADPLTFYASAGLRCLDSLRASTHKSARLDHLSKLYEKSRRLNPAQLVFCLKGGLR